MYEQYHPLPVTPGRLEGAGGKGFDVGHLDRFRRGVAQVTPDLGGQLSGCG